MFIEHFGEVEWPVEVERPVVWIERLIWWESAKCHSMQYWTRNLRFFFSRCALAWNIDILLVFALSTICEMIENQSLILKLIVSWFAVHNWHIRPPVFIHRVNGIEWWRSDQKASNFAFYLFPLYFHLFTSIFYLIRWSLMIPTARPNDHSFSRNLISAPNNLSQLETLNHNHSSLSTHVPLNCIYWSHLFVLVTANSK